MILVGDAKLVSIIKVQTEVVVDLNDARIIRVVQRLDGEGGQHIIHKPLEEPRSVLTEEQDAN